MGESRKTILVTGCAGFIGSNFCRLYADDFDIVGIDKMTRGSHPDNVSDRIRFHEADICSNEAIGSIIDTNPELIGIVNFAAESHVDFSLADDATFWRTNIEGVRNLARHALRKRIRLLQVSTDEVYGPSTGGECFEETARMNPRNPYAASKAAGELLVQSYHQSYGLDAVVTRGCNTMGERQFPDKVVPKAVSHFLAGIPFPLYKTPAKRLWIDVELHCQAIRLVFERGKSGEIYNVAAEPENEIETAELVKMIRDLLGKGTIRETEDRAAYDLRYCISSRKIREQLEWKPRQDLRQLVRKTVDWYANHTDWITDCTGH